MMKIRAGEVWPIAQMTAVGRGTVRVPGATAWTHVQFRRFAGCPICALHLRQFVRRKAELDARGISEVVVFASAAAVLAEYAAEFPFALVADPSRALYRRVGVERSMWALAHPKSWLAGYSRAGDGRRGDAGAGGGCAGDAGGFFNRRGWSCACV